AQRDKDRLTLEGLVADTDTKKFKAGRLETDAAQDDAKHNLSIRSLESSISANQALAAQRRAKISNDTGTPPTVHNTASALIDSEKGLVDSYTRGEDAPLTYNEAMEVARAAIVAANREGKDPSDTFRRALQ